MEEQEYCDGGVSRRSVLGAGVAGGVALGAGAVDPAAAGVLPAKPRARGTTLAQTLVKSKKKGKGGYRKIVVGPGEPHLVRRELVRGTKKGERRGARRGLLAMGQLTDMHLLDAQSPARTEFLDRFDDPGSPYAVVLPFQGAYRPQEMLTAHVADATIRALRKVRRGPVTGLPLAFTVTTGDNVDNTQYNELRWQIDLLDGQPVRPDSGDLGKYEGVADQTAYDTAYWHPDGPPPGQPDDTRIAQFGFPKVPGLLDTCRQPFKAKGLGMPWISVFGNHDGLAQGTVPSSPAIAAIATGDRKITNLPPGADVGELAGQLVNNDPKGLQTLFGGPSRQVSADPNRRPLSRSEVIAEYFKSTGAPQGHGYTAWNVATGNAYYTFGKGKVRGIALDTVNPNGGSEGSIDQAQLAWLTAQLIKGSRRYLDESGKWVKGGSKDKLFVLFSHHTIDSMDNNTGPGRVLGPQVRDLLLRFPNVILWVNGHTHRNSVLAHKRKKSAKAPGGFWEVNTASHVDWPQQARTVELVDNRDGTLSVFGTIVDHVAPPAPATKPTSPIELASLSRELAANDWQERTRMEDGKDGRRGAVEDRNVELLVPTPFKL
ncbi:TIGR03767 family metallophosphoesterase [Nocardioides anomalus]|uniref:TIGR03767 family metallophosphoesterase n=1 Tax=Nocardioides anomalus TaxID=2712223 RepID=A0A6G6WFJ4_9ACTN|nr:TIGR03767 family metallophosphoesterase [Nocardioides anomalus]QIG43865.1 TIGR03767 family metallophosphoesterase [Nocardioides anomalus]